MMTAPASLPPPSGPPAGWYPDPAGWGVRYFDGRRWAPGPPVAAAPPEPDRHPTLPFGDALIALAILALSLVAGKLVVDVLGDAGTPLLARAGVSIAIGYGPSLWWCWRIRRREGGRIGALGWRFKWVDAGWGPLVYLGAVAAQLIVVLVSTELGVPFESNVEPTTEADRTASYIVAMVMSAVVAAPLAEELVFRGVVLRGLASRLGVVAAVPMQGVLFGAAHVDPSRGWGNLGLALALSAVGCAFGLAAVLTRRIGASIIAHTILNGVVLTLVLTGVTDDLERDFGAVARGVARALAG